MAETITIARPYAEAVFRLADQASALKLWSKTLQTLATVAEHPEVRTCIGNPMLTGAQLTELFISLCKGLDDEAKNLVRLLVDNRRIGLLPEIRDLYEELKNQREGVLEAIIHSAFPLDETQRSRLVADLEAKFKQRVDATVAVDPELIGGVKVVVGDQVIDASVRAKLAAMEVALKS